MAGHLLLQARLARGFLEDVDGETVCWEEDALLEMTVMESLAFGKVLFERFFFVAQNPASSSQTSMDGGWGHRGLGRAGGVRLMGADGQSKQAYRWRRTPISAGEKWAFAVVFNQHTSSRCHDRHVPVAVCG